MAILDPRVLELIETLVAARLDWLAFELIEGIRLGRLPDESEEALAAARQSVRSNAQPKARGEPHVLLEEPKPIPVDEQVEWAAAYVEERLDAALEQLQASLETLDFVVEATIERQDPQDVPTQAAVFPARLKAGHYILGAVMREPRQYLLERCLIGSEGVPAFLRELRP